MIDMMRELNIPKDPYADLEIAWMEEYLHRSLRSLQDLPEDQARRLRIQASTYACCKRASIAAKEHFADTLKGSSTGHF